MSGVDTDTDPGIAASAEDVRVLIREFERQVVASAGSLDGYTFTFVAPVSLPLRPGGYVLVDTPAGPRLGHLREVAVEEVEGPEVVVSVGSLRDIRTPLPFARLVGSGVMLDRSEPFYGAAVSLADSAAVQRWSDHARPKRASLVLGNATLAPDVGVELDAGGFARHTFLCGQSGSGKSYAMGLLLEQLLINTTLPIVVLDPNSDATRLAETRADVDPGTATRWRLVADRIAVRGLGRTGDERLRLRFFDLELATQQALLGLDPLRDREEYDRFRQVLEAESSGRSIEELEQLVFGSPDREVGRLALRVRNLGVLEWPLWSRDPHDRGVLGDLAERDWRCLVVDLGSVDNPAERALVSAAILSDLWERRAERRPVLVVIDEAHNVCPPVASDLLTAVAAERAVAIASEGRKYGLHLLVATQRPTKVHENVLSQCDNLVLMRMNSAGDLARIAELFSFAPPGLLGQAATFGLGQALVCGRIASHPTLVTTGRRIAQEGGADVAADWAEQRPRT